MRGSYHGAPRKRGFCSGGAVAGQTKLAALAQRMADLVIVAAVVTLPEVQVHSLCVRET